MNEKDNILNRKNALEDELKMLLHKNNPSFDKVTASIAGFYDNVKQIDSAFEENTKLKTEDFAFIVFCAGLQACRQYLITDFKKRLSDKESAIEVKGNNSFEKSNRNKTKYYCSIKNIISNPVPFDALEHDADIRTGISGRNHRTKCLGHYPELGYIFGTANIMTSTITTKEGLANIQTFHVKTETITRNFYYKKTGKTLLKSFNKDFIYSKANTITMFEHCFKRIKSNPRKGIPALVAALAKEHEHLRSDELSKQSLPFPLLSFTPEISEMLQDYGLDYINLKTVAKQTAYSSFVNLVTEVIYYAYHIGKISSNIKFVRDEVVNDIIKIRLRKIINVANVISTSTNIVAVLIGIFTNNMELLRKLDIGGEMVTLYNLSHSADFIMKVKNEYIKCEIDKMTI